MLSKSKIKLIRSLEKKKNRDELQLFVAEGNKLVSDLIQTFECEWMIAKTSWMATQGNIPAKEIFIDENDEIRKISLLKTPQDVLAIFKHPICKLEDANPSNQLILALDGIQDPGNLGTIIRSADWFGIEHIVCSLDTADIFGPKAIQATMGALTHVNIHYTELDRYLKTYKTPVYGTFLDGENIYEKPLSNYGIIVMGNEGNGIRPAVETLIEERLYIPNYPANRETSESLNVAIATAIICAEFRRKVIY
ncbi:MAG: RNA methyltransferase [Tannerella sp.]|jgi:TrmH family RNA methyltransferase|nr:RNA methyltransferase [Tannerella sp.]